MCVCVCVIISSWVAVNYIVTYLRHIDQLRDGVNVPPESDVEVPTGGLSSQASTEELSSGSQITPETPTTTTDTTDSRPAENADAGEPNRTESRYPRRVHRPPQRYSEQNYW